MAIFFSCEGDLLNSIKPREQSSFDTYCVQMRQNVNILSEHAYVGRVLTNVVSHVLELIQAKTSESFNLPDEHEGGLIARFHFDIPNEILTPEGDVNQSSAALIQSLPASLYIPFADPALKLAQCNVSYRDRAQVISSSTTLAGTS